MRKILFGILLCFCIGETYCQKSSFISVEANTDYYSYLSYAINNKDNDFGYGVAVLVSQNIRRLKISSGIVYADKYLYVKSNGTDYPDYPNVSVLKNKYNLKYINIPVIANIEVFRLKNNFTGSILVGFEFKRIIDFSKKTYYKNGETLKNDYLLKYRQLGIDVMMGFTFSKSFDNNLRINVSPFVKYNLMSDFKQQYADPNDRIVSDTKLSIGVRIGVEYIIRKKKETNIITTET
ncbi:MAG: hypothetical protein IJL38_03335 [Bacteroidales bacterium]|nr:hypothetical protein [Bacteroidales bacterium]